MSLLNLLFLADDDGSFDHVAKLSYVARPGVSLQRRHGVFAELARCKPSRFGRTSHEMTRHQRDVGVRMGDGREDLVTCGGVPAHLLRFFGVESLGRVDHTEINNQLANVMEVTGDRNSFNFLVAPAHRAGDEGGGLGA